MEQDLGYVYLRFTVSGGTSPILYVDQIFCSAVQNTSIAAYQNGSVYVDETSGTSTGTVSGVDATVTNRSDDFDNAQTVADSLGLKTITNTPGNSITLSAALQGYIIGNVQCTLNGGSQNVDATRVNGGF